MNRMLWHEGVLHDLVTKLRGLGVDHRNAQPLRLPSQSSADFADRLGGNDHSARPALHGHARSQL
jgi:hypothetical protein